jgi:DNA replication complex GINS SLD5-like protein
MVERPDEDTSVFVRLLADAEVRGKGPDADSTVKGKEGDVFLVRWEGGKGLVEKGVAELI